MAVDKLFERYSDKVGEVVLGATPDEGGTRSCRISIGGDSTLPFLVFEGEMPNRPVIAMEIADIDPTWPDNLKADLGDVTSDPAAWAGKCVDEWGADLICLTFLGADPEGADRSPEACAATLKQVLEAVSVPLIVKGCGNFDKDNAVLPAVAEAGAGENLLIGTAEQDNYKTLTAACMVHKHNIVAQSPIDINICKQLNILINEMNLSLERIVIDPTIGALGYGIEYGYSIMERIRLGALQGDKMLAMPVLCNVGHEAWRAKESSAPDEDFPGWGPRTERGLVWEAMTGAAVAQAGAHVIVLRHPRAVALVRQNLEQLLQPVKY